MQVKKCPKASTCNLVFNVLNFITVRFLKFTYYSGCFDMKDKEKYKFKL